MLNLNNKYIAKIQTFLFGGYMARHWKFIFYISLLVNCFFAWKIFYPHAPDDTARTYYNQSVINIRLAVEQLNEAHSSKANNEIIHIHTANQLIHEALFDMKYYEDAFNRRGIQAGSLSAELYTLWQGLSGLEMDLIEGKKYDDGIGYIIDNLTYWSKNLPDTYTKQTVGQIEKTMNDVSELKSAIKVQGS
jgi:hypothetical protein